MAKTPPDPSTLPLLPDAPLPPSNDQHLVWDALAFMQAPATVTRLTDLLQQAGARTARGAAFHPQEVRKLVGEVAAQGLARLDERGQWHADPQRAWLRFAELLADDRLRARWWAGWRAMVRFDNAWHLELFNEPAMVGAMRVVVLAGRSLNVWERLGQLSHGSGVQDPGLLAQALLMPFDEVLWATLEPELQLALLRQLLALPMGDSEAVTAPLWHWLQKQTQPSPERLHDFMRRMLGLRMVFCGDTAEARRVLAGLDDTEADAVRAAAAIADGHWDDGAAQFETALKERTAITGKRKLLFAEPLQWVYAVALLARQQPAQWTAARRFVASEAGKKLAEPYTFWGVWQEAIDQRLGDATRTAASFKLTGGREYRLPGLQQTAHLLLAAWLGHRAPAPAALRELAATLDAAYAASGQLWLALLARRATALLLDEPPAPADAARPFPIAAPAERWREALNAIVALGAVAAAGGAAARAESRIIWAVRADAFGRVRSVTPLEQKAGARGLGKPKAVTLAALMKRNDLPNHDTAVLRGVKKATYGNHLLLDPRQAVQALVRHPHVAWEDAPEVPVEVSEALPRLEVLTRDAFLQFRLVDALRPEDMATADPAADNDLDDLDDLDLDDDDEVLRAARQLYLRSTRHSSAGSGPEPVLLLRDGPGQARLVRITPAQLRVAELISQGWQVPAKARDEIDAALRVLGTHFQLASDAEAGHEVPASSVLRAELTPQQGGLLLHLVAAPFGDFGPRLPPGSGRERVTTVHQGVTLSTRRHLAAERAQLQRLTEAVDWLDDGDNHWPLDDAEQALAVVEALATLAPSAAEPGTGIVTEWPKGKPMRVRPVVASQVRLQATSRGDWLALDGELVIDGDEVLRLEKLLELVRVGKSRYVALGDGEFLALTDTLRQQLADLRAVALAPAKGDKAGSQRVATMAALAWAAQPGAPTLGGDAAWQKRCATWDAAQQQNFTVPAGLQAELRDYQLAGWLWLMRLAASGFGAVLADDMGLGKTLQTLALLLARAPDGPSLVVAPTSVCGNWLAEATRFAPGLRLALYGDVRLADDGDEGEASSTAEYTTDTSTDSDTATGAESAPADSARQALRRAQLANLGPNDVLVCSYGLLQRDAELLAATPWHTVVLDEAQAIKNASTGRARAALGLQAACRVALTGTPIENRLAELWSIMAFANPGLLGSIEVFQQRFAGPIERDGDPAASRRLRRLVAPFLLRRTKTEVLADLPPRTEIVHRIVPGSRERALLEALRRDAENHLSQVLAEAPAPGAGSGGGQAQMHILAALTRLRRAACDPRLVAPEAGLIGAKVQAFEQLALELAAGRHKALVFSQFTDFLALLRERLDSAGLSYQYLDGSTPQAQRMQRVNAFQAGEGDFFLISLKAGGFGLNLTMADYVIIADPWWNPAAEDQASGRAHRIGQSRPVTVYRLVLQGSIEDRIVSLHQHKRGLAEGVLAGQDGGGASLGATELMALLRGDATDDGDDLDLPTV